MEFYRNGFGQVCAWIAPGDLDERWPNGLLIEVGGSGIDPNQLTIMGKTMDWSISDEIPSSREIRKIEAHEVTPLEMMAIGVVLGAEAKVTH